MAKGGAPKGNTNAAKGKAWTEAIIKALHGDRTRIDRLAKALLDKAESGDIAALKELGDRLEGKVTQPVSGPDGGNIPVSVTVSFK